VKIVGKFELTPHLIDSVVYIQWAAADTDKAVLARWNRFSAKRCAGRDGIGKYYDSKAHANQVIRDFKTAEKAREKP